MFEPQLSALYAAMEAAGDVPPVFKPDVKAAAKGNGAKGNQGKKGGNDDVDPQTQLAQMKETCDNIARMHFLLTELKVKQGLLSVQVARATDDYFDLSYEQRKQFLGCASTFSLCKTIIMQNTRYADEVGKCPELADDPSYPRFIICVVQFEKQLKAQNLTTIMRDYQHSKAKEGGKKMGIKGFHYRMAEEKDALELSGYDYNAITPFFMNGGG